MNKNFYSPTMLTKYINCKHIISNEYHEESLKLKRKKRTITDELRIEKGLEQFFNLEDASGGVLVTKWVFHFNDGPEELMLLCNRA